MAFYESLLLWLGVLYSAASLLTILAYARDKSAAIRHRRRTAENTLHTLALLGGWPGALLAQRLWRHKTQKQPFRMLFWGTVIINSGVLVWLLSPNGAASFQEMLKDL